MTVALEVRTAVGRLATALAFGGALAAAVVVLGTRDLESYEHAFFSIDRGTAADTVRAFGQPVYTLALGLGVRLPLQGSLGASPAARLAPSLPEPLTYWLLLTLSIGAAVLIVRHALEPLCGRLVSSLAMVPLFWSVPVVNYSIHDDWVETTLTYCACVACVFAPHALLALIGSPRSRTGKQVAAASLIAGFWGLMTLAHAGHWPILAATLVLTSALAMARSEYPLTSRVTALAALAIASWAAIATQAPDLIRELQAARAGEPGELTRIVEGPTGDLLSANLFPMGPIGPRMPFTYFFLGLLALAIGLTSGDRRLRRLVVGSTLASFLLGIAATTLPEGTSALAPTLIWLFRDPAAAFAVFGAACAARALQAPARLGARPHPLAVAALGLAALQGLALTVALVLQEFPRFADHRPWTHAMSPPEERSSRRGLSPERFPPGQRLALWPQVRDRMRSSRRASTEFADGGYLLVTAWTKQRTMRGLTPNDFLFNQSIELAPEVLCDADAVLFLQLRYLLRPSTVPVCGPWTTVAGSHVDGWLDVDVIRRPDDRLRGVPAAMTGGRLEGVPALSAGSSLLSSLVPLPQTSLAISSTRVAIHLDDPSTAAGTILVLPVTFDEAWRASSGSLREVGGLLGLAGVDRRDITLTFVPDAVAVLRALGMTAAQLLAAIGLLGLALVGPIVADGPPLLTVIGRRTREAAALVVPMLPQRRDWLYLTFGLVVVLRLFGPAASDDVDRGALLLPLTALVVARLARSEPVQRWGGGVLLAAALVRVVAGGSLSADAVHDPLFWGAAATVALGVSAGTGRWPVAALAASAVAGACTAVATLLPVIPDFDTRFPRPDGRVIGESFSVLASQLGVPATVLLIGLCFQAVAIRNRHSNRGGRVDTALRGGLAAAVFLAFSGAVPTTGIGPGAMALLGLLLGLAEGKARHRARRTDEAPIHRKHGSPNGSNVPVG